MKSIPTSCLIFAICFSSFLIGAKVSSDIYRDEIGETLLDISISRNECEKSGDECVMVFDFVPVKKEKAE